MTFRHENSQASQSVQFANILSGFACLQSEIASSTDLLSDLNELEQAVTDYNSSPTKRFVAFVSGAEEQVA